VSITDHNSLCFQFISLFFTCTDLLVRHYLGHCSELDDIEIEYHPKSRLPTKIHPFDEYASSLKTPLVEPEAKPWKLFRTRLGFELVAQGLHFRDCLCCALCRGTLFVWLSQDNILLEYSMSIRACAMCRASRRCHSMCLD